MVYQFITYDNNSKFLVFNNFEQVSRLLKNKDATRKL
ncbi:hypothetical protein HC248_02165 [Polaromonas vacuolata]|uniref:Uncharacterized protein n=1 Tax=Polaromonas vacuolata TaxID=37448 RepID=A0A6H2HB81_9BURK|nr:hypothetical protein HC248_02165 [Polaromonas vacuolata]